MSMANYIFMLCAVLCSMFHACCVCDAFATLISHYLAIEYIAINVTVFVAVAVSVTVSVYVYVFRTVFRSHSVFTYIYLLFIRTVVAKFTMNFSYPSHTHSHTRTDSYTG